ncbi:MAG: tRNA epoxyqueuosine(34) reductase QueG [Acidimicrobiia bacterium]|nr:tRNA epoxyqueuosine(34) reductase QueG [Acidimicrobiia bacterium]MYL10214.1 tRNA epoxyqueuosine(34) reductase QueG [Acidimicrobiia bacterium]
MRPRPMRRRHEAGHSRFCGPVSAIGAEEVIAAGLAAGLDAVGIAPAEPFETTRSTLVERREQGLHGGMAFTYRNPDRSTDPGRTVDGARSLVVGALGYRRATPARPDRAMGRVASYARRDHYGELRDALGQVAELLQGAGYKAAVVADDNALVDREAAQRAGLGWYGKNSNILLPGKGSWFVLGSVITTAALDPSTPVPDQCGPCRRCLDGCPTGAIVAPGVVDARRCLAWLVQADGDFPLEFREALGDRIYGCDDCQEVCPPNRFTESDDNSALMQAGDPEDDIAWVDLVELLQMDDDELMSRYGRWYIPKREPRYVRRNALIALGNSGRGADPEVVGTVHRYQSASDPMLVRHADWAAARLGASTVEPV